MPFTYILIAGVTAATIVFLSSQPRKTATLKNKKCPRGGRHEVIEYTNCSHKVFKCTKCNQKEEIII